MDQKIDFQIAVFKIKKNKEVVYFYRGNDKDEAQRIFDKLGPGVCMIGPPEPIEESEVPEKLEYKIAYSRCDSGYEFEKTVNSFLEDGWELYGSLNVVRNDSRPGGFHFFQTMIRE